MDRCDEFELNEVFFNSGYLTLSPSPNGLN